MNYEFISFDYPNRRISINMKSVVAFVETQYGTKVWISSNNKPFEITTSYDEFSYYYQTANTTAADKRHLLGSN